MKKSALIHLMSLMLLAPMFALASADQSLEESSTDASQGQTLFEQHCLSCHTPRGAGHGQGQSGDSDRPLRQAPPMAMVKKHYLKDYPERDAFVAAVSGWVAEPKAEQARLGHALEKFGLMPAQNLDADTRALIAGYIYDSVPAGKCKKGGGMHGQHGSKCDQQGQGGKGKKACH